MTAKVVRRQRELLLRQNAKVIWFTGLSGAGKSTLATRLELHLHSLDYKTYLLDGDIIRTGLCKDLGFSNVDRKENIRRIGELSKLFLDAGVVVLSAFISPFEADRALVRNIVGSENFVEVFVDCPLAVCEQRDTKGLYRKARAGELKQFTGIDSPYERPRNPDVVIHTDQLGVDESITVLADFVVAGLAHK